MKHMRGLVRRVWNATPTNWRISPVGRLLKACYRHCINAPHEFAYRCALLARTARLLMLAAGLPLSRQFLILRCLGGSKAAGLFSEFSVALGLLDHYERWRNQYAGVRIDFETYGLYYDPGAGTNWWAYYFEPVDLGASEGAVASVVSPLQHDIFQDEAERLSRARGFEIIDRYIRPRPQLRDKVESYVREHFHDAYVIGIHYRGTDYVEEAPSVAYEQVRAAVLDAMNNANPVCCKLFLATDEQAFLDYMLAKFPDNLIYRRMFRSVDGKPIHLRNTNNYEGGEDAVIDCLVLSRTDLLVRTASNLSLSSALFNPALPQVLLSSSNPP